MLKMNLITRKELCVGLYWELPGGLYGEVCWELSGELWGEVNGEVCDEVCRGMFRELWELGIPIRANFSLSKISRV
jgi:hypothetical protein